MSGDTGELASWLEAARHAIALTGAGVSTESGIPDFRGDDGLWADADPMQVASIDGFREDPARFWRFWADKFANLTDASPNVTHRVLAELEARGRVAGVVTQNIDGLHTRAGSQRVWEVHGSFRSTSCLVCGHADVVETTFRKVQAGRPPICSDCGALEVKPDVVLFGELLPPAFELARADIQQADLFLVLGSSLGVHPVADLVPEARRAGARIVVLNRDPGPYDDMADLVIHSRLGPLMGELSALLGIA
ncbi:MAG: NAD-dependent deacylase [Deltaproteobacteria bacterium]|nr:NAD-dependent deacylase [Deltaproteobacteria bacterium]